MSGSLPQVIAEEFLTCKICLESFRQPKSLACLHTFCLQCLQDYRTKNLLGSELPCPACRQVTVIPEVGVQALRDNFFIAGLQDVIAPGSSRAQPCDSCVSRGDPKPATMRCLNCQECLCADCHRAHQRLNLTKNHVTIATENPASAADAIPQKPAPAKTNTARAKAPTSFPISGVWCAVHRSEEGCLYCQQCRVPLCVTCKLTEHDAHACVGLAVAAGEERRRLQRFCGDLSVKARNCEGLLSEWQAYDRELTDQEKVVASRLEARRRELHTAAELWYEQALRDLRDAVWQERQVAKTRMSSLTEQRDTSRRIGTELSALLTDMAQGALFTLAIQLRCERRGLASEGLLPLALTRKLLPACHAPPLTEADLLGSVEMQQHAVIPNEPCLRQNLALLRTFETRPTSEYRLRFDASGIAVCPDGSLIVTDRQLDRVCIYSHFGACTLQVHMSLIGKPISALQLDNRDIVIAREKSSLCVFGSNGKDKRVIKESMSKPCCICHGKEGTFLVLDYDLKAVFVFCSRTYAKIAQIHVPYKTSSKWDKLTMGLTGHLYICAHKENCIYKFTGKGRRVAQYGRPGSQAAGQLYWPRGLAVRQDGSLLVADSGNDCLQLLVHSAFWLTMHLVEGDGEQLRCPTDVALVPDGSLAVLLSTGTVLVLQSAP